MQHLDILQITEGHERQVLNGFFDNKLKLNEKQNTN